MIVFRRRLVFWLIKAYIKKSGKTIMLSFLLGLCIFAALLFASRYSSILLPASKKVSIGLVGAYTRDDLPPIVLDKLSHGLTRIEADNSVQPDIAASWEIQDNGKTYIFHLKPNMYFSDGSLVTAQNISYDFSDVSIERPNISTLVFKLKDAYAPFPVTVSKPIFKKGFIGVGEYQISNIELNGSFIQSLSLSSVKNRFNVIRFQFYPREDTLKMAYVFGEISHANGLNDLTIQNTSLSKFPNSQVEKNLNTDKLVTLFFNNNDPVLSDKKTRLALTYSMPQSYPEGQKAYLPYPSSSVFYNKDIESKDQDYTHAKLLLNSADNASSSAKTTPTILTITTLKKYRKTADQIANSWKNIGIDTKIEETDTVPTKYQVFLGEFNLSKDPDQYTLWHTGQSNNITNYKNLRIDKLLEDGRKITDIDERKKIYADFQKYLLDDAPAYFLYFPIEYNVVRK